LGIMLVPQVSWISISMKYIKQFYQFIKSRGVSDRHQEDNKLTELLNIICFLTSFGAFNIFLATFLFTSDSVYMSVSLGVSITYLIMIILHHFHLINEAKIYFSIFIPFWYVATIITIGGHFSQSIAAVATIVITFLMFKEQVRFRNGLIIYNIFLFILPTLYVTFYSPIFGVRDYPIDEIVVFLLCLGWISIVFSIYESNTLKYIESLESTNRVLDRKNAELERFNYIASHDLKSPLRNITSFIGLIKKDIKKGKFDQIEEFLGFAETGALQMNELIKGVLEISRVEDKKERIDSLINLNTVLYKVLINLQHEIEEKNALVESQSLPSFLCKESDFIIIFQNIIQNGLKYNKSTAPIINFTADMDNDWVTITITDNGIGIKKEYHDQIFEYFKRLHTTIEYPGTGLGLGLVKKLVEKYEGRITVKSEIGSYSSFIIKLPAQNALLKKITYKGVLNNP